MNIFELLMFASIITAGYFCGKWMGVYYGIVGWIIGFILGSSLTVAIWLTLHKLTRIWYKWRPIRPICKNEKCSFRSYKLLECHERVVFQCRCGTKYLKKGRRFMEILDDSSTKPYMRRYGLFGKWVKDM